MPRASTELARGLGGVARRRRCEGCHGHGTGRLHYVQVGIEGASHHSHHTAHRKQDWAGSAVFTGGLVCMTLAEAGSTACLSRLGSI
jgi:hypothetical protein